MSRIKTTDPYEYGKFRATGLLGRIEFDKNGYFDVPKEREEDARKLCTISETLTFIEGEVEKKPEEPEVDPNMPVKTSQEGGDLIDHTITQEDLKNNPELEEQGVKVGDNIQFEESDPIEDEKKIAAGEPAVSEEPIITDQPEDLNREKLENTEEEQQVSDDTKREALKEILGEKSMDQLRKICTDSKEADEKVWSKFSGAKGKPDLINYILDNNLIQ
jgi:hypothetical protein